MAEKLESSTTHIQIKNIKLSIKKTETSPYFKRRDVSPESE